MRFVLASGSQSVQPVGVIARGMSKLAGEAPVLTPAELDARRNGGTRAETPHYLP